MNLPDANVLLAMCAERHAHHSVAVEWHRLAAVRGEGWGMCRLTTLALLRMLTNPAIMGTDVQSSAAAWKCLEQLESDPLYRFLEEPAGCWPLFQNLTRTVKEGHRHWTDAYLAALAESAGCRIVTFDRNFSAWPGVTSTILKP
ncbi:MAG: hypothetical protein A3G34_02875 [Candidatus Lindowbacteria bacterium RIFCSPLOWO2_12_FULL_62_27]|nr:MAG: hypothetical protein A3G34_02875 [Candidatus Lindowbacteria bacterium RIFCSPLOWO2_12_FULL_62_27]OGH64033.1 MAG: hypothetical protein A3I06_01645 [Candidatus Lindowbacteria bacterium RIFCSPLOWO2_02_FULL_62_12]